MTSDDKQTNKKRKATTTAAKLAAARRQRRRQDLVNADPVLKAAEKERSRLKYQKRLLRAQQAGTGGITIAMAEGVWILYSTLRLSLWHRGWVRERRRHYWR